ncbi:tagatose-bisphosphate aldolase [Mammaliicoccus sp. Dog046]|uniref:tagatose-bisphosphate aldolase n=1 Tax=Mammaliicoccus sp. Dog046 TaxID=3034233 RepID=UPI002B25BBCE|nr:tagatose-bisphosphate aldolase [Mammaliicoccus sp. Dog046]WQK84403.1 tagatose-bisphosphate aldolase [Mammaliicoccus sp. Dog046]
MVKDLSKLTNDLGQIAALAIDQRGALKRMLGSTANDEAIENFKTHVSEILTQYASSILLDPEYGLPASEVKHPNCGLILAYEKTGYDKATPGRFPDLLNTWSVHALKEKGADAIKLLVYFDVDESDEINKQKEAFVERVGSECEAEQIPFFLEIVSYDANIEDNTSKAYAEVKPKKVNEAMRLFSEDRFKVDVLKVEVPVNMNYVEGFTNENEEAVYTQEEAKQYFKEQSDATHLPYIYLSAGVSTSLFQDTLKFAHEAGAKFNGVLCGRSTWAGATQQFVEHGDKGCSEWLNNEGVSNIQSLNEVIQTYATPITK